MAEKNLETKTEKKAAKKSKKPNVFSRAIKYLRECKGEIKKITWPTALQTTKNFGIVKNQSMRHATKVIKHECASLVGDDC